MTERQEISDMHVKACAKMGAARNELYGDMVSVDHDRLYFILNIRNGLK
jgi:hypothetical protein